MEIGRLLSSCNYWNGPINNGILGDQLTFDYSDNLTQPFRLPLPTKPSQACLASQQLLHRSLLEVALLGDQLVK